MTPQREPFKVLLIGDLCHDVTIECESNRPNPEADVPLLKVLESHTSLGMAGFVRKCLSNLQLNVTDILPKKIGTKTRYVKVDIMRRSLVPVMRVDEDVVSEGLAHVNDLAVYSVDAVVVSDYNKGFVSQKDLEKINDLCKQYSIPLFVDTKKSDLSNLDRAIIKINALEATNLKSYPPSSALLITTQGAKGAWCGGNFYPSIPAQDPVDVCGAGDAFLAGLVHGYLYSGGKMEVAMRCALHNASISVSHQGTYAPTLPELARSIETKWNPYD